MKGIKFLWIVLLICFQGHSQIVNVESLRKVTDTSKWSGNVSLDVGLIKNVNSIFMVKSGTHIQYLNEKNLILLVSDLNFQQLEGSKFVNRGVQHLRYNYRFRPRLAWEFFLQGQYDAISNIDFRGLAGTGPRFKLSTSEKYKFYLGSLVMLEYEESEESFGTNINRDVRGSAYFSFSLYPTDQISVVSTTYYQPKFSDFSDYRISNESRVAFKIFKNLGFISSFTLLFDAFPPTGIPKSQYEWTNGLVYTFD